jgi:putative (di)nucleoside polyphosphate hydrolase
VLAVFTNAEGQVLVAERRDEPGTWQFPQGGREADETAEEALYREMAEELGCRAFDVVRRAEELVRYEWPEGVRPELNQRFRGQEQTWFAVRFRAGCGPDLDAASDRDFRAYEWVTPSEAVRRAVGFKRDAYERGLAALGFAVTASDQGS